MFGAFRALRCFAVWFLRIPRCNFHTRPRSGHSWRRWWSELSWGIELEGQPFSLSGFASHLSMLCLESNGFVPKRSIHGETAPGCIASTKPVASFPFNFARGQYVRPDGSAGPGSYFFAMPKTIQSMSIYIYNDVRFFCMTVCIYWISVSSSKIRPSNTWGPKVLLRFTHSRSPPPADNLGTSRPWRSLADSVEGRWRHRNKPKAVKLRSA